MGECPGGCCPNVGWFCCPGDEYCAASEEYCKKTTIAEKMISMAAPKKIVKQDCPGTECPGGCCPNAGWFCCPGDEYCAASEEYCKKADFAKILMSMAAPKKLSNKIARELNAQEDAAQMLDGSAVLEMNTVQPVKNIARKSMPSWMLSKCWMVLLC